MCTKIRRRESELSGEKWEEPRESHAQQRTHSDLNFSQFEL